MQRRIVDIRSQEIEGSGPLLNKWLTCLLQWKVPGALVDVRICNKLNVYHMREREFVYM